MATPTERAPISGYVGASPDDLNQLLAQHQAILIFAPSSADTVLVGPTAGPSFGQWQALDDGSNNPLWLDQPFTMSGTVLDRIVLPLSTQTPADDGSNTFVAGGIGQDVMVGIYADSGGIAQGAPLAQTFIPKEFLATSACADDNGVMLGQWQQNAPNTALPTSLAGVGQNTFVTDGTNNVFSIGGTISTGTTAIVASAPMIEGGIGAWQLQTSLPVALNTVSATYWNGYLIVVGGATSTATVNTVYTAAVAIDGTISAWTTQTPIPVAQGSGAVAVVGNTLYSMGGGTTGSTVISTVNSAPIGSDGSVGTWTAATANTLPLALGGHMVVQVADWLIVVAGETNTLSNQLTVYGALMNTGAGTIGPWIPWPSLAHANPNYNVWVINDNIIVTDGVTCQSLSVNNGGPANAWVNQPIPPNQAALASTLFSGNTIICVGLGLSIGATTQVTSVPSLSVPLHVAGLTSGTVYHVVVNPVGYCNSANRVVLPITTLPASGFSSKVQGGSSISFNMLPSSVASSDVSTGWYGVTDAPTITYVNGAIVNTTTSIANAQDSISTIPYPVGSNTLAGVGLPATAGTVVTFSFVSTAQTTGRYVAAILRAYTTLGACISVWGETGSTVMDSTSGVTATVTATLPFGTAYFGVAIAMGYPAVKEVHTFSGLTVTTTSAYLPVGLWTSGRTQRTLHVAKDIVNNQASAWLSLSYDYWGKPIQVAESTLPLINLLAPNTSNFGGPVPGTTAGWIAGANTTLAIIEDLYGGPQNTQGLGLTGQPTVPSFPLLNAQQSLYMMFMQNSSGGSATTTATTATGTSGVPVQVGSQYTGFIYFASADHFAGEVCTVGINWYKADGTACSHASDAGTAVTDKMGSPAAKWWWQSYVTAVAPTTAAYAALTIACACTGYPDGHYVQWASLALDGSTISGTTPQLAYWEPQATDSNALLPLEYDAGTGQLLGTAVPTTTTAVVAAPVIVTDIITDFILGQTTMSASMPGAIASDQSIMQTTAQVLGQQQFESTTNLAAGSSINGVTLDNIAGFSKVRAMAFMDKKGTLAIQASPDGSTWYTVASVNFAYNTAVVLEQRAVLRYNRAVLTNTGSATTTTLEFDTALVAI